MVRCGVPYLLVAQAITTTIRTWHERYGELTQTVQVTVGATATVDIEYAGDEQPPTAGVRDLHVPAPALHAAVR